MMDREDASYYTDKISNLEREQIKFPKLSEQQIAVVRSILQSMKSTLMDVSESGRVLSKGLEKMANHINEHNGDVK
jgi:hypothetical protein